MRNMEAYRNTKEWKCGIRDGIPIALGYVSVSFTFGLMAVQAGLSYGGRQY